VSSRRGMSPSGIRIGTGLALAVVVVIALFALVNAWPTTSRWIASIPGSWRQLDEIGQRAGGVSALLSAMALCGVAASLLMQRRQTRIAQEAAARTSHFELMKLFLNRPSLDIGPPGDEDEREKVMASNLWVSHWAMLWDLSMIDKFTLRLNASRLFTDSVARDWWGRKGRSWAAVENRHTRQFVRILTEEREQAIANVSVSDGPQDSSKGALVRQRRPD
jgi:hypothetical protein